MSRSLTSARLAKQSDLAIIEVLGSLARAEAAPTRGGELLLAHEFDGADINAQLREAVSAPIAELDVVSGESGACWVGAIEDVVVGYAVAAAVECPAGTLVEVRELFVHPDGRGVGVGAALLGQVQEWAQACGAIALESQVLPGNRAAKNFFERMGMKTRLMRVSTPLGPPA